MIRAVLGSMRDGYRDPDEWNARCREFGYEDGLLPVPTRWQRIRRAATWGMYEARDRLASWIDPGPHE